MISSRGKFYSRSMYIRVSYVVELHRVFGASCCEILAEANCLKQLSTQYLSLREDAKFIDIRSSILFFLISIQEWIWLSIFFHSFNVEDRYGFVKIDDDQRNISKHFLSLYLCAIILWNNSISYNNNYYYIIFITILQI